MVKLKKCQWCGKYFNKTGLPNKTSYCSATCKTESQKEGNRKRQYIFYKKHKFFLNKFEKNNNLGYSNLTQHPHTDLNLEIQSIKKEMKRIGIK